MQNLESPLTPIDELTRLELKIARRADQLMRHNRGSHPDRDYWREAELEIWSDHFGACE